jgi:hypothetical protein
MGGMHLHAAEFMAIALDARDRAAEARRSDRTVMAADALVSVVMATAATEAFINELGAYYELRDLREPRETATGAALAEVEKSRGSTELKYLMASLGLSGQMFDRGAQPFQDFSTLMKIRNDLMHPRPLDEFDDAGGVTARPTYVREFERRGMTCRQGDGVSMSWLNLLETDQIASWACQAAVEIIVAVVEMTPPDGVPAMMGRSFSEHYRPRARAVAPRGGSSGGAVTP